MRIVVGFFAVGLVWGCVWVGLWWIATHPAALAPTVHYPTGRPAR
jgi:hypothetical protein